MKKPGAIAIGILMSASCLFAQEAGVLPFTRIDRDPVTSALAGAGGAMARTAAFSAFDGAATLPFYGGSLDAAVSYQLWAPSLTGSSNVNASVAYKISPRLGVSLGYAAQIGRPVAILDDIGRPGAGFTPFDHLLALGAGVGLGDMLSLGINGRYAIQSVGPGSRLSGVSADVYLAFQPVESLRVAAGVSSLGPKVSGFRQPSSAGVAIDWSCCFADVHSVELVADADYYFLKGVSAAAGLQYCWNGTVFARAGYRYSTPVACPLPSHASVGAGVKVGAFRFDVSYLTASKAIGNTVCAGLGYSF